MRGKRSNRNISSSRKKAMAAVSFGALIAIAIIPATAQDRKDERDTFFWPGNLVVSRSVYDNNPNNVTVGEILPPNCASTIGGCGAASGAPNDGDLPVRVEQRHLRWQLRYHFENLSRSDVSFRLRD